jgi:hypothetical protein
MREPVVKDSQVATAGDEIGVLGDPDAIQKVAVAGEVVAHAHLLTRRQRHAATEFERHASAGRRARDVRHLGSPGNFRSLR